MIKLLLTITFLIFCIMMITALGFTLAVSIYRELHKNVPPSKEEWKIMD